MFTHFIDESTYRRLSSKNKTSNKIYAAVIFTNTQSLLNPYETYYATKLTKAQSKEIKSLKLKGRPYQYDGRELKLYKEDFILYQLASEVGYFLRSKTSTKKDVCKLFTVDTLGKTLEQIKSSSKKQSYMPIVTYNLHESPYKHKPMTNARNLIASTVSLYFNEDSDTITIQTSVDGVVNLDALKDLDDPYLTSENLSDALICLKMIMEEKTKTWIDNKEIV